MLKTCTKSSNNKEGGVGNEGDEGEYVRTKRRKIVVVIVVLVWMWNGGGCVSMVLVSVLVWWLMCWLWWLVCWCGGIYGVVVVVLVWW